MRYIFALVFLVTFTATASGQSILPAGSGTDFYFAFGPNERPELVDTSKLVLELTSVLESRVTIEILGTSSSTSFTIPAESALTINFASFFPRPDSLMLENS